MSNISEQSSTHKKNVFNNENSINNDSSDIKIVEETIIKNPNGKNYQQKEKEKKKTKKDNVKKMKNDIEIVQEKKIVKVKALIDEEFIDNYDPIIQDNSNPKLKFFIDTESVSESDKDLSSASLSNESMEDNKDK